MRSEKEIIAAVGAGEVEAFSDLVRAHQARVRLACLVRLGNPAEADDAAQETFLKAFKALDAFKKESAFLTWILKIADNHCCDLLRTRSRRQTDSLDVLFEEKGDALEHLLAREESKPYDGDEWKLLGQLFAALPEEDREMITLREVHELSYEEIAERLACSLDAVKGRLKRARQILQNKWGSALSSPTPESTPHL